MGPSRLNAKARSLIRRNILQPLSKRYLVTPLRQDTDGEGFGAFSFLFTPLVQWRDILVFRRYLRQTDIFLVGHPKSGNTWLAYMLAIVLTDDFSSRVTLGNIKEYSPVIHGRDSKISNYQDIASPRVFRNELPVYPDLYPKSIYLIRDPRAVLTSYFHMYRTIFDDFETTMEEFVDEYISQGCIRRFEPAVRWDQQVLEWLERAKNDSRVTIVKYEDMVLNREAALKQVLDSAQISYTSNIIDLAEKRGGFREMRSNEEKYGAASYPGEIGKRGRFIRRGKIEGWKDEMHRSTAERIEKEFAVAMKAAGYL
jgi:hypothetical protein